MRTPFVRWLPWLLLALASAAAADRAVGSGRVDDAGVQLRWHYEPLDEAEGLGRLSLELRERASGSPLRYAPGQLAAWLQRQRPALSEGELSCRDRVKSLVSTGIGRRADVDLNTYRILTLNADRTLAVINPFVALNNAKLESIVPLPGTPLGWVQLAARGQVWVLLAGAPLRVAAVDLQRRRVTRTLALGGDAEPQARWRQTPVRSACGSRCPRPGASPRWAWPSGRATGACPRRRVCAPCTAWRWALRAPFSARTTMVGWCAGRQVATARRGANVNGGCRSQRVAWPTAASRAGWWRTTVRRCCRSIRSAPRSAAWRSATR